MKRKWMLGVAMVLAVAVLISFSLMGCKATITETTAAATTAADTKAAPQEEKKMDSINIAYVMPSTESQYWGAYILVGVQNACKDIEKKYGTKVNLKTYGPATEAETDAYLKALENVIATKPDVLLTGSLIPDATAPVIDDAKNQGVFVNFISLGITDHEDSYGTLYSCEMGEQGTKAADAFLNALDKKGIAKKGIIGMQMSVVVPILELRLINFKKEMAAKAPDIKCLDTVYNQNDVNKAQSNVENQMSTYGDKILGFFGANNISGDGIALATKNAGSKQKYTNVAIDSDDLEISALKDGNLDTIVVQTPYEQAYRATINAYEHLAFGKNDPKNVNIPSDVVTQDNMNQSKYAALLNPLLLKEQ